MVDASTFDAASFMNTEVAEPLDTKYIPIPPGDYKAVIGAEENDVQPRVNADGTVVVDIMWHLLDCEEEAKNAGLEPDQMRARQGIFLEMDGGSIATGKGKNVSLGRVREALGQNKGKAWHPGMLRGAGPAVVKVVNKPDKSGSGDVYSNVVKVAPLV